jgi:hypothetical protein
MPAGDSYVVEIESSDTIENVKQKLEDKVCLRRAVAPPIRIDP